MPKALSLNDELPLHRASVSGRTGSPRGSRPRRARQLKFEGDEDKMSWRDRVLARMRRWVQASTGSPSDGMGKESSSGTDLSQFLASQAQLERERDNQDWVLDEVVVSGDEADHKYSSEKGTTRDTESDPTGSVHRGHTGSNPHPERPNTSGPLGYARHVLMPNIHHFFEPRFEDPEKESEYQKQMWYTNKKIAFFGALFLYINWALYLILNQSVTLYEKLAFYGGLTMVTLPLPFMVAYDLPQSRPILFQTWMAVAVWYCAVFEVIEMHECGYLFSIPSSLEDGRTIHVRRLCGNEKDFLSMMYYATALPSMGLFVVAHRAYIAVAVFTLMALQLGLILPQQSSFIRNIIGFALFWVFIFYLHYSREMIERRMYMLNTQLKIAYRGEQKAQIAESKASQAKRRFASYIFHEVRVPLNTAMLAFQNLQANNAFKEDSAESQNIEIHALEASLFMMQQVLNDVLDLERMDSGRFESNPRPFPLHRAINSIMGPVGLASDAKGLTLRMELDKKIDDLAGDDDVSEGLWVVGDEIRLRQVLTNLASNAVKFTPESGGEVALTTKLLEYVAPAGHRYRYSTANDPNRSSSEKLNGDAVPHRSDVSYPSASAKETAVGPYVRFRLEVSDSGPGIRPSDLIEHRLFQPFVQTAVGKSSGKGTGLGLAIVRQIVTLSGGRLGVHSRRGQGAVFWVELSYPIATAQDVAFARSVTTKSAPDTPPLVRPVAPRNTSQVSRPSKADRDREKDDLGIATYADPNHNPLAFAVTPPSNVSSPTTQPAPPTAGGYEIRNSPAPILTSSIPVKRVPSHDAPPSISPEEDPLRVLCVDDDELTRTLMMRMLQKQGCIVETASDGPECIDLLLRQRRRYDLVTLDNFMPGASGEEVIRQIREAGRDDLVVGCTGNALSEDQASYIEAGVDRILTKPVMLKDLKHALREALLRREDATDGTPRDVMPAPRDRDLRASLPPSVSHHADSACT